MMLPSRSRRLQRAAVLALPLLTACSTQPKAPKASERVTGNGGSMVRYSSKQTVIDLTTDERAALDRIRVRAYPAVAPARALRACIEALTAAGYTQVAADAATEIVSGERHEALVSKRREMLRGLLKSQGLAYGAKPDHKSTYAQLVLREEGGITRVWASLNETVWDSNGDARTRQVTDPERYEAFFRRLDALVSGTP
ncbi:hypothetical protein LMG3328_03986 [Achromobacter ruhlandii]|uniref:Lipoprotein n=1 Tax=Achromobacter ruhlandii TaxID=72557 RepID=A0A6S7E3J6_9BURK|nr:hypothetical protein LMG3328_03986 [Achromobacter ruhlandii]